jgi:hypothetical protein
MRRTEKRQANTKGEAEAKKDKIKSIWANGR